jgi:ABC-2 type transport system ATP-binding protein
MIGLVPQEVSLESFDTVINVVRFSRGLFGKRPDDAHVEKILKQLSLWDKRDSKVVALSGGMKRRVLIAKALSYEPRVLFLDEPTAGVDVDLRRDMWRVVGDLRASGVTIILTTHYIEEAEAIADRIAVILKGEIILTEDKAALMQRMGRKKLTVRLADRLTDLPASLAPFNLTLGPQGDTLVYAYDTRGEKTGITTLLNAIRDAGLQLVDLDTQESSLEEIFLGLVRSGQ